MARLRIPPRIQMIFRLALQNGTPGRAARLAAVVGSLLVLINQWEAVTGNGAIDWLKLTLTFCVPYLVSTYTSVSKDLFLLREADKARQTVHQEAESPDSPGNPM
ncbi:nitrate/nitrite transporter NrtS [Marinobacter mobilis]|uniref:Uncharacterized protein n=1 Tax=Marinobacter mobilis TaxID=488533 RepID=A0A1H3CD00_9GAMM|nr:nitrate/nitrite transporter NrtS [Marinobacter mobilis]SDW73686.1 hypothetical protein SAMN04487960_1047 [Marinobacter mobilis]SDX51369.1 hypothetical protein SAMN04487960_110106 [Marinobacter mobilis]